MVPAPLLTLAEDIARTLGREWGVEAVLGSPLVAHPFGHRVMLHDTGGRLEPTAHVTVSTDPQVPLEKVTATRASPSIPFPRL